MGNIIPLDGNIVSAVRNKRMKTDGAPEWGRTCAWILKFSGC